MRRCAVVVLLLVAAGAEAGCGTAPRGTLGADGAVKLSFGVPGNRGQVLTLTEMAVTYTRGRGITIESVEPLTLRGSAATYLGTALLLPPRQGFAMDMSRHFPHIIGNVPFARLPYTTLNAKGSINLGLGFALRRPGLTVFNGVAVRYREHSQTFVAVVPLAARICVPAPRGGRHCTGPPTTDVPDASVKRV